MNDEKNGESCADASGRLHGGRHTGTICGRAAAGAAAALRNREDKKLESTFEMAGARDRYGTVSGAGDRDAAVCVALGGADHSGSDGRGNDDIRNAEPETGTKRASGMYTGGQRRRIGIYGRCASDRHGSVGADRL